jgi:hypothetical protein
MFHHRVDTNRFLIKIFDGSQCCAHSPLPPEEASEGWRGISWRRQPACLLFRSRP